MLVEATVAIASSLEVTDSKDTNNLEATSKADTRDKAVIKVI